MRRTKIVCTLGPACEAKETLHEMIRAGMNIARLNMAHSELAEHSERIRKVRQAAAELHTFVPLMLDIKGPEIRIGTLREHAVQLSTNDVLILTARAVAGDASTVSVNYADMPKVVHAGSTVLIDDGLIELKVLSVEGDDIHCKVVHGGRLKSRKGVNLPGIRTTLPGITARDIEHIHFALRHQVEMIAVSFVRKAADIGEVKRLLKEHHAEHVQVIAKIENEEGISNLDEIIATSDAIMVARGDLGVEIPIEDVPLAQKRMIEKCNAAGKPVMVATHMLESMQVNPRPTRAEVSDISTAVLQRTDMIMLSGETAAGKYPVESVRMMAKIAERTEASIVYPDQVPDTISLA